MKKFVITALAALLVSACVYPYKPELEEKDLEKQLVVDGKILVGGTSTITVNYLQPLSASSAGIPLAEAWVEDDKGNKYYPDNDHAKGSYFVIQMPWAPSDAQYRTVIKCDAETYVSAWLTPDPAPEITDIRFTADEGYVHVLADLDTHMERPGNYGFMYEETWEFHSDFYPELFINPETWEYYQPMGGYPFFWCYKSVASQGLVLLGTESLQADGGIIRGVPVKSFARTDTRNHRKYSILVKEFALSREAYDFNRQLEEMAEIGGDLFTPDPGALPSNVVCESNANKKAMGMVLVGNVSSKRVFFTSPYLIRRNATADFVDVPQNEMSYYYYELNYRPVQKVAGEQGTFNGWAPHRCINCVEAGGTLEKPYFWE